ncbi:MAG: hypothetical protein V3S89_09855 [Desulfobacterales bacterium]
MKRTIAVLLGLVFVFTVALGIDAQMKDMRSKEMKSAVDQVMVEKAKLVKAGKYVCCLKKSCNQCAIMMGGCPCGKNAANDKPVCHECKGGWAAGNGTMSHKKPEDIKVMPRM